VSIVVKLTELVGALDIQDSDIFHYLNVKTGEIVMVAREEMEVVKEEATIGEYPEWQQEAIREAQAIVEAEPGQYMALPTHYEVDEYMIMEKFCLSVADQEKSNELYSATKGSGAFRRFKEKIQQYGLAEAWYKYRGRAFEEIARSWCKEHHIDYV
jgi:hypothetical protein